MHKYCMKMVAKVWACIRFVFTNDLYLQMHKATPWTLNNDPRNVVSSSLQAPSPRLSNEEQIPPDSRPEQSRLIRHEIRASVRAYTSYILTYRLPIIDVRSKLEVWFIDRVNRQGRRIRLGTFCQIRLAILIGMEGRLCPPHHYSPHPFRIFKPSYSPERYCSEGCWLTNWGQKPKLP